MKKKLPVSSLQLGMKKGPGGDWYEHELADLAALIENEQQKAHPGSRVCVTDCNRNAPGLQSARFSDHIRCLYAYKTDSGSIALKADGMLDAAQLGRLLKKGLYIEKRTKQTSQQEPEYHEAFNANSKVVRLHNSQ